MSEGSSGLMIAVDFAFVLRDKLRERPFVLFPAVAEDWEVDRDMWALCSNTCA